MSLQSRMDVYALAMHFARVLPDFNIEKFLEAALAPSIARTV